MYLYSGVQINLRVNLNCVRMGFIARSIFVGKFIISGLKPVHLSFLYLQNKKRLLQGVHVDFGSRGDNHVMVRHNLSSYTAPVLASFYKELLLKCPKNPNQE